MMFYSNILIELKKNDFSLKNRTFNHQKLSDYMAYTTEIEGFYNDFCSDYDDFQLNNNQEEIKKILLPQINGALEEKRKYYNEFVNEYYKPATNSEEHGYNFFVMEIENIYLIKTFLEYQRETLIKMQKHVINQSNSSNQDVNNESHRLKFNLSKREIVYFFKALKEKDIIKVTSQKELANFMENNFSYKKKYNNNNGKYDKLENVESEMSSISGAGGAYSEDTIKNIKEKFIDAIEYDFWELKQ